VIAHNRPDLGESEAAAAAAAVRSGWVARGPETASFEREFAAFLGLDARHAVATSSGTAALFVALHALGASGASVAIPAYACAALRNAVAMAGARERLVDTLPGSPNGDFSEPGDDLAIVPHTYGIPLVARPAAKRVVADCCHALGATVDGMPIGLDADVAIYSFYATKLMTTAGQGGMIVARDERAIDAARDYLDFDGRHDRLPRFNLQIDDVRSAVGRVQLRRLPAFLARREALYAAYERAGVPLLGAAPDPRARPVRYRAVALSGDPNATIAALAARGVTAINPLEEWELLGEPAAFPNARALTQRTVSLPLYPALTDDEQRTAIDAARAAL
jgi:perosamine synthetase